MAGRSPASPRWRRPFDVILAKLDNVDAEKKQALYTWSTPSSEDFEQYMISLGRGRDHVRRRLRPACRQPRTSPSWTVRRRSRALKRCAAWDTTSPSCTGSPTSAALPAFLEEARGETGLEAVCGPVSGGVRVLLRLSAASPRRCRPSTLPL